jgi:hypothetical protein
MNETIDDVEVLAKVTIPGVEFNEENQKIIDNYVTKGDKKVKLFDLS